MTADSICPADETERDDTLIRIAVDSTCDMPAAFAREHGVVTLPLHVLAEGKEYLDRVTISTEEVYDLMRREIMPSTAQVNPAEAYEALLPLVEGGEDVVVLSFSAKLSSTCQAITMAAQGLEEEFPGRRVVVLDSKSGSLGIGLIAMAAVKAVKEGCALEEVLRRCRFLIDHVEHIFVITNLDWMIRGGRVSRTMGFTANLFHIKPVLQMREGEMEVIHKIRGEKKSMEKLADLTAQRIKNCPRQLVGIAHANDLPAAQAMERLLSERLPEATFVIEEIGAVLGVHLGIGGVGVLFFNQLEDPEQPPV